MATDLEPSKDDGGLMGGPLCQARAGLQHPTVPPEQPTVSRGQQRAGEGRLVFFGMQVVG